MHVIQLEQIIRGPLLSEVGDGGVNGGEVHGDELGLHAGAHRIFQLVNGERHTATASSIMLRDLREPAPASRTRASSSTGMNRGTG